MSTNLTDIKNRTIAFYLKHNILKPYLIHIEFELLNIQTKLQTDKILNRLINLKSESMKINDYKVLIEGSLIAIRELINIHGVD